MNEHKSQTLSQRCFYLFKDLEMKPSLKGYDYILEAVVLRGETNFSTQKIYGALAERNGVSWTAVERAIRFVKEKTCENRNKKFKEIFGNVEKMTNSEFIAYLSNYIKYQ